MSQKDGKYIFFQKEKLQSKCSSVHGELSFDNSLEIVWQKGKKFHPMSQNGRKMYFFPEKLFFFSMFPWTRRMKTNLTTLWEKVCWKAELIWSEIIWICLKKTFSKHHSLKRLLWTCMQDILKPWWKIFAEGGKIFVQCPTLTNRTHEIFHTKKTFFPQIVPLDT